MKINVKLTVLFTSLIIVAVATLGFLADTTIEDTLVDAKLLDMQKEVDLKTQQISTLHDRASEDIVFAVKNNSFSEYFELEDTKKGNVYNDNNVLQYTSAQSSIKSELETWIYDFQNKFTVDETCVIDRTGQQQTALVLKEVVSTEKLSSTKTSAGFFNPTFEKESGESYLQYPYVSPATKRWVFAYTTPITTFNDKPAFYHFEMPMYIFQNLMQTNEGRMYVVDPDNYIVADNFSNFNSEIGQGLKGQKAVDFFPSTDIISTSNEYKKILDDMNSLEIGETSYSSYMKNGEKHFVVYEKLPTFYWTLVYEIPYSQLLSGQTTLDDLRSTLILLSSLIGAGGIVAVFVISSRISKPISILADSCKQQDVHKLEKISLKTDDEINDVTNALNNMIEKVNEVGKMKEEFSSMVTHELKTPLTPILGWCQTLKNPKIMGELTDKQKSAIEKIQTNAERLKQLIGDILDAEKLELEKMKFDYVDVDIKEFFAYLESNLRDAMKPKNIKCTFSHDDNLFLKTDRNRLEQIFNNLIFNSIDFVNPDGKIVVTATDAENMITFSVTDNGIGIPQDKIGGLFKKFYQVDTSMSREHGGTGLGLAIVKGIVDGIGGEINVKSTENVETKFTFTLPKNHI